jgi:hypothetical protein
LARGAGATVFFTSHEAVFALGGARRDHERALRLQFPRSVVSSLGGVDRLPGSTNYVRGRVHARWRTRVPTFARVRYAQMWRGIDVSFYGSASRLEYDIEIAPGADPRQVALRFAGARRQRLDAHGDLVVSLPGGGEVRQLAPVAYQRVGRARRPVNSRLTLSHGVVRIRLGRYDRRRPVTIDPSFVYSTYLGGTGADAGLAVAVDKNGDAYVTGVTSSADFPTQGAGQPANRGGQDAFVAKLNSTGTALLHSTYVGGSGNDYADGIAVDSSGEAVITGSTTSADFPTKDAARSSCGDSGCSSGDAFVAKLASDGTLAYSTYLGGSGADVGRGVAVDSTGAGYVVGYTFSADFPTVAAEQASCGDSGCALGDAFVTKLDASGAFAYSTFLGGTATDYGLGVAVDSAGGAYVTGLTSSTDFPTARPTQPVNAGGNGDAFVTKLNASGTALDYSTYLGGSGQEYGYGIALDPSGDAYVTGSTGSTDFPTRNPLQAANGGGTDAFAAELGSTDHALVYATYVGGNGDDAAYGVAVDSAGEAHLTGSTNSSTFPTRNPEQLTPGFDGDAFATKISAAGRGLVYSTYLGGRGQDYGTGVALDPHGNAVVTGATTSTNFPTVGAEQPACGDSEFCAHGDAFVTKLPFDTTPPTSTASVPACRGPVTVTVADDPGGSGPQSVRFRLDGGAVQTTPTAGNPGTASIPMPEGNHTLEWWGDDASGNEEVPHHVTRVQVDTTPPSLSIFSDQRAVAYEVGDPASVTVAASDATSGLRTDPSASRVALPTSTPGPHSFTRSATDNCGHTTTTAFDYKVIPYPVLAVTVNVEPAGGTVLLLTPRGFVALTEPRSIPVGSTLDVTHGVVRLTTARPTRGYQRGMFTGGEFSVTQSRFGRGIATLRLIDKKRPACGRATRGGAPRSLARARALLRGTAHGNFRSRGRYAAATVRGTIWTVADRCDGTLTTVQRGTVIVTDFRLRRSITVHAGSRYLARAR